MRSFLRWVEHHDARAQPSASSGDGTLSTWTCADGKAAAAPIEPLVSHLRHPEFHCVGPERDTLQRMFSAAYIILPFAAQAGVAGPSSAKKLFFDAGASLYVELSHDLPTSSNDLPQSPLELPSNSPRSPPISPDLARYGTCALGCQKWFVDAYRAKGIDFDRCDLPLSSP